MEEDNGHKLVDCPHCGQPTSSDGLRCIFCGERLNLPVGGLSWLTFKAGGLIVLVTALLLLAALLAIFL